MTTSTATSHRPPRKGAVAAPKSGAWKSVQDKVATFEDVALDDIYIDSRFQRRLNTRHVDRMVDEYNPAFIGTILLARVQGGDPAGSGKQYACINGQHRCKLCWRLQAEIADGVRYNHPPVPTHLHAQVYDDITVAEAAALFHGHNAQFVVPRRQRQQIALVEGNPIIKEVARQAAVVGYRLFMEDELPATMPCVDVGVKIVGWGHKHGHPDLLTEALTVMADAAGGPKRGSVNDIILQAIAKSLYKYPQLDRSRLCRLLTLEGVQDITFQATESKGLEGGWLITHVEDVLMAQYNALPGIERIKLK